jgi:hypothetical protein
MEEDEPFDPVGISLLGAEAEVLGAAGRADLVEELCLGQCEGSLKKRDDWGV